MSVKERFGHRSAAYDPTTNGGDAQMKEEDPVQAKLDAILLRIGTIEAAVTSSADPDTRSA
jgi:hypothetical protein